MKTYLTYGFAMAFAGAVLIIVLYLLGFHSDPAKLKSAQIIGMGGGLVIGCVAITLGTLARRAEIPAAEDFNYGRAFGTGFMIALFAALFGIVTTVLYATVINPDFVDVVVQAEVAKLEARGMSSAQIEVVEKFVRRMVHPAVQAVLGFFSGLIFGTVISLVTAAIFKRPASAATEPIAPPTVS